jgi:hypothetical protein
MVWFVGLSPESNACGEIKRNVVQTVHSRNKQEFALPFMFRVSFHTASPCERTALVPFPHRRSVSRPVSAINEEGVISWVIGVREQVEMNLLERTN